MTDHPILFSAPMVRAVLAGRKTQTRRVLTQANTLVDGGTWAERFMDLGALDLDSAWIDAGPSPAGNPGPYLKVPTRGCEYVHRVYLRAQAGDRLWVREAWRAADWYDDTAPRDMPPGAYVSYRADGETNDPEDEHEIDLLQSGDWGRERRGLHMPRWASRLTLEVTGARIERVQDISDADARAEGLARASKDGRLIKWGIPDMDGLPGTDDHGWPWQDWHPDPRAAFARLWDGLNATRGHGWDTDPWVVVTEFRQVAT